MSTGFAVEILYVDGSKERHELTKDTSIIGSSSEADLCIALDELHPEHLLAIPRAEGCWISVSQSAQTSVLYNGQVMDSQEVPWGAELDVGTVTLRICEPSEVLRARQDSRRSLLRLVALTMMAVLGYYMLQSDVIPVPKAPANAPELFETSAESCIAVEGEELEQAEGFAVAANARWQRYPFDAQEGIAAALLFAQASSCYRAAGISQAASEMGQEQAAIVEHIDKDYQTLRLQLARALKGDENRFASELVARLTEFVVHKPGPYLRWLGRVRVYLNNRNRT